jgi:hypothetical protein
VPHAMARERVRRARKRARAPRRRILPARHAQSRRFSPTARFQYTVFDRIDFQLIDEESVFPVGRARRGARRTHLSLLFSARQGGSRRDRRPVPSRARDLALAPRARTQRARRRGANPPAPGAARRDRPRATRSSRRVGANLGKNSERRIDRRPSWRLRRAPRRRRTRW